MVAKLQSGKRGSYTRGALKNREAYLVIFLERYTLLTSHRDELVLRNFPDARLREISCARPRRIQPMLSSGVEGMIGITQDSLFGPLIAFGLGGIHVEIINGDCFRVTPISDRDAGDMVRSIRGYRLLQGFRGRPPGDIAAVEDLLLRVSRLVEELPEIAELDLNPIFVLPPGKGCMIVDARIRVAE